MKSYNVERMRVLVVEDEESMAASLRRGLEAEGYVVEHARDGEDGLWRATEFDFDAIVLDIMIPKLNGYALTQKLRAEGSDVPILMLTAKLGELDQTEALDAGADDFLSKPFSYPVLLARLRALIRRGSTATTSLIQLGDLCVDLAARQCSRGDTPVALTAKEFQLLAYLAMHAGEVQSKSTLLQHVWHEGPEMDANVVEVYVGYLRKKIDVPFGRRSIETVRGHGYRIDPDGG
jgi:DNA-binding response OmpR family regulator